MTETRITNVIVPEVFGPYIMERSLNQNRFFQAGVLTLDANLNSFLAGGSRTFNVPFWKDLTGATDVPSESVATTVNAITTDKMIARRQIREKAWGSNDLAAALAGADPQTAIADRVAGFWAAGLEDLLIYSIRGVIADNIANDSSDLVVDISTEDGNAATSANKISATRTIEAIMKQGDRYSEMSAMCVHSVVYSTLLKNDLIDFVTDSNSSVNIPMYMGLRVIVSDDLPVIAGGTSGYKYHTYLFKSGAIAYAENPGALIPVEPYRDPTLGSGRDILYTRKQFAMHPLGFSWVMAADTGITPSDSELYTATSWDRVYNAKNCGLVALISNG